MRVLTAGRGVYDDRMSAYDGMTDEQLMNLAKRWMLAADDKPLGSTERAMKWAGFDSVMNELRRRAALYMNAALGLPDIDI